MQANNDKVSKQGHLPMLLQNAKHLRSRRSAVLPVQVGS
jgi:hypothetical protein